MIALVRSNCGEPGFLLCHGDGAKRKPAHETGFERDEGLPFGEGNPFLNLE